MDGDTPDMQRIIIAVDPSGCSGPEDIRSDEIGIIVGGLGTDGRAYVLEDLSGRFGPQQWGKIVVSAFDRWRADAIVAETNFGGAMVREVLRAAASEAKHQALPFKLVHASRGKVVRAEPIAALYGTEEKVGKISHVGIFPLLEDQMMGFTTAGFTGERSPDRADALVWCMAELFPALSRPEKKHYEPPIEKNESGAHGWLG
jgi:phage terminase large subunit-like protein